MGQFLRSVSRSLVALACLAVLVHVPPVFAEPEDDLLPGDNIRITVLDNPDVTTEGRISARGTIRFPLIGTIRLGGLTPTAAAHRIATQLKEGDFIRQPEVSVNVIQGRSRQVSVLGQVARPGRYPVDETGATLTDILALAGGIAPSGDDIVTVIRTRSGTTQKFDVNVNSMYRSGDLSANLDMDNGDTVFVRRAPVFYIYGEVQRAGTYRLEPNTSVMQAISVGGGITMRGTERGLRINRRSADGNLTRVDAQLGDLVKADDIIYVSESLF